MDTILGDDMYILYLSIYSFILWSGIILINFLFLPLDFVYPIHAMAILFYSIIGLTISYVLCWLLNKININRYLLSIIVSILLFLLEWWSGWFVWNEFVVFTLLLSNFLYSFIIVTSLNQKNLI